ncbi:transposase [Marinobacter sp. G11]|uniref:transposase n=1 Tax=Marinobacter sp. G11 TaxID=2903522 RepID=UPI003FA5665F
MTNVSVTKPYQKCRRYSKELKARIVAECLKPGASVSRISLDNGLTANMVRHWMSEARRAGEIPALRWTPSVGQPEGAVKL